MPEDNERYDADATISLIETLFPVGTVEILQRLTGVPMKTAKRWTTGETRVPPSLLAKLRDQSARQKRFAEEVRELTRKHAAAGTFREALQGALDNVAEDRWFGEGSDEL